MTLFLAVVVWDTRRVQTKQSECFGAFKCQESSIMCCWGKLASVKQMEYSGSLENAVHQISNGEVSDDNITASKTIEKNSLIELCCGNYIAPKLFNFWSSMIFLLLYFAVIAAAIYWSTKTEVYFNQSYFVSDDSPIKTYFEINDKYFTNGGEDTFIIVQNEADLDFSDLDN